jgi:hypothetical protein
VCRYSTKVDIFEFMVISARAGFESATVFSPLKKLSSIIKRERACTTVRIGDTKVKGVVLSI